MAINKYVIADIYNKKSEKDTDILAQEAINTYINKKGQSPFFTETNLC